MYPHWIGNTVYGIYSWGWGLRNSTFLLMLICPLLWYLYTKPLSGITAFRFAPPLTKRIYWCVGRSSVLEFLGFRGFEFCGEVVKVRLKFRKWFGLKWKWMILIRKSDLSYYGTSEVPLMQASPSTIVADSLWLRFESKSQEKRILGMYCSTLNQKHRFGIYGPLVEALVFKSCTK